MSSHQEPVNHAKDSDGIAAAFEHLPKNCEGLEAAEVTKTTVKFYFRRDQENGGHGDKKNVETTTTKNGGVVEDKNKPYGGVCGGGAYSSCCYGHAVANNIHGCPNCGYWGFVAPPPWVVAVGIPVPSAPPLPDDYYSPAPPPPPPPGTEPPYMMFNDDNTSSMCTIQ